MRHLLSRLSLTFILPLFILTSIAAPESSELPFDLKGKTRVRGEVQEFWVPNGTGITTLILPKAPREIWMEVSPEGAAVAEGSEDLILGRWHMTGTCVPNPDGKGHIVTSVTSMEPLGPGYLRTEDLTVTGTLEVAGDPNAEDLHKSSFTVHAADGIDYWIPSKKFKPKPSGLTYPEAAKLAGQKVLMKARVQIRRESPHRVATITEFGPAQD